MNEARFSLFYLYQYEIHNLDIENKTILADPRSEVRWENIKYNEPIIKNTDEPNMALVTEPIKEMDEIETQKDPIEDAIEAVQQLNITYNFSCTECKATFKKEGNLNKHKTEKHQTKVEPICIDCGKLLATDKSLERHMKTHLT